MIPPPRRTAPTAAVLFAVSRGHRYGFDIIDATGLQSGTVYPILRRLVSAGLLRSSWESIHAARSEQRPARRYYQLTGAGQEALREALERYPQVTASWAGPTARPRPS